MADFTMVPAAMQPVGRVLVEAWDLTTTHLCSLDEERLDAGFSERSVSASETLLAVLERHGPSAPVRAVLPTAWTMWPPDSSQPEQIVAPLIAFGRWLVGRDHADSLFSLPGGSSTPTHWLVTRPRSGLMDQLLRDAGVQPFSDECVGNIRADPEARPPWTRWTRSVGIGRSQTTLRASTRPRERMLTDAGI